MWWRGSTVHLCHLSLRQWTVSRAPGRSSLLVRDGREKGAHFPVSFLVSASRPSRRSSGETTGDKGWKLLDLRNRWGDVARSLRAHHHSPHRLRLTSYYIFYFPPAPSLTTHRSEPKNEVTERKWVSEEGNGIETLRSHHQSLNVVKWEASVSLAGGSLHFRFF